MSLDPHASQGLAGSLVAGRYRLVAPLGAGAQGSVWAAEDLSAADAPIALKLMPAGASDAEPRFLLKIDHPALPRILDHGPHGAGSYLAMERVDGVALHPSMGADAIARAAVYVASALQALHGAGVVHGDVKAANILVGPSGTHLVDLGLAGARGDGAVSGTPSHLAPEAMVGQRGPASDLYALGVTLAMCLGGCHPRVEDPTDLQGLFATLARPSEPREACMGRIPADLRESIAWLLAWDPERRPHSAATWLKRWIRDAASRVGDDPAMQALASGEAAWSGRTLLVGQDAPCAQAADAIERALNGEQLGVLLDGPEGSGRRRLADEVIRRVKIRAAARGAVPEVVDEIPSELRRPTILRLVDASPDAIDAAVRAIERVRRFSGPYAVAVLASCAEPVDVAGLERVAVQALDRPRCAELLAALEGDPPGPSPSPLRVDAWMKATAGLAGRVVRTAQQLGPSRLPIATFDDIASAARSEAAELPLGLSPEARRTAIVLAAMEAPLSVGELGILLNAPPATATELVARGLCVRDGGDRLVLCTTLPLVSLPPAERTELGRSVEATLARVAPERHGMRASMALLRGDLEAAWQHGMRAVADAKTSRMAAVRWLDRIAAGAPDKTEHGLCQARVLIAAGRPRAALEVLEGLPRVPRRLALEADALRRSGDTQHAKSIADELVRGDDREAMFAGMIVLARDALDRGDTEAALRAVEGGMADGVGVPDAMRSRALEVGGLVALAAGDLPRAHDRLERCELAALTAGDNVQRARARSLLGMIAQRQGNHSIARGLYADAWRLATSEGDEHGAATYLLNQGAAALECGVLGEARRSFEVAARLLATLGRLREVARALVNLASLLAWMGDRSEAVRVAQRAGDAASVANDAVTSGLAKALEAEAGLTGRAAAEALEAAAGGIETGGDIERAIEVRARAAVAWLTVGESLRAESLLAGDGGGAMVALARVELALRSPGAPVADRLREAMESVARDPSVEHTIWLADLALRVARAGGDWSESARARADLQRRLDVLAATLPEEMVGYFRAAHPSPDEPAPVAVAAADDTSWRLLARVTRRLNEESRLRPLLELVMDDLVELTHASRGFLLLREANGELKIRTARNIGQRDLEGDEMALSRSVAERVATTGEPVVTVDATADGRFDAAESVHAMRLRSILAVPLVVRGNPVGTVYVDDRYRAGAFGDEALAVARAFADAAALAIHNARTQSALRRSLRRSEALSRELSRRIDLQQVELEVTRQSVREDATRGRYDGIIGQGPAMTRLLALCDRVAPTSMSVLVQGQNGSGKELIARAIHANSPRAQRPFVAENCGAIPETLLESVLFGHVRGAFTGADRTRPGLFEASDGGTLFLDEVGEMSPGMQAKLLRVLQDGEVRPVGTDRARKVDVRVIAATHRDLLEMVRRGTFREDLYYRLAVIVLTVPALRDRREDIPALVAHFLQRPGGTSVGIDRRAMARLVGAPWPGNVRQLANEVQRACVLADGTIREEDLSSEALAETPAKTRTDDASGTQERGPTGRLDIRGAVHDVERGMVEKALAEHGNNQSRAARALGISRFGLQKKLKRLGITVGEAPQRVRAAKTTAGA